ncbi:rhamnosidase, partial [Streptomyces sp. NPDC059900]
MISRRRLLSTTATAALGTAVAGGAVPAAHAAPSAGARSLRVTKPTVEYVRHPLGLDVPRPRLSWPLASAGQGQKQTAYQVRVATSPGRLAKPDVWDSGKVASGDSVLVPYAGPD